MPKKDCFSCGYKRNIPGDCHVRCMFNWKKANVKPPKANQYGIASGWYLFPMNFDPIWQEEQCMGYAEKMNQELYKSEQENPFTEILQTLLMLR